MNEAPLAVVPSTAGRRTCVAVLGLEWRAARAIARANGVRCVVVGRRIVAIDVADWRERVARPVGALAAESAGADADDEREHDDDDTPNTAAGVLAALGLSAGPA